MWLEAAGGRSAISITRPARFADHFSIRATGKGWSRPIGISRAGQSDPSMQIGLDYGMLGESGELSVTSYDGHTRAELAGSNPPSYACEVYANSSGVVARPARIVLRST